ARVGSAVDRPATIIGKDDVARKVLVLTAQAVGDPTAYAGMTCEDTARTHLKDRRAVSRALSVHRTDQGQIISVFGHVWKQLGNIHPALTAFAKRPQRGHQTAGGPHRRTHFSNTCHLLALPFEQQ